MIFPMRRTVIKLSNMDTKNRIRLYLNEFNVLQKKEAKSLLLFFM